MSDVHSGGIFPGDHAHEHDPHPPAPGPHPAASEEFDQEINVRAILWTTVGLVATCILSVLAMWGMFAGFDAFDRRHAEAPPPMAAAGQTAAPEPRLQPAPPDDMAAMHAEEDAVLQHARWVDQAHGTVRLPIDVAIDVLAARGLPRVTTPPLAEMAAHGSMADEGRPPTDQPSPGTLLPPPGFGIGSLGPPSAGAGQQMAPAMPEPMASTAPAGQTGPNATAAAAPTGAAPAGSPAPATPPAAPGAARPGASRPAAPGAAHPPVMPPPPPPPGRLP
jgi:hypothetical protein